MDLDKMDINDILNINRPPPLASKIVVSNKRNIFKRHNDYYYDRRDYPYRTKLQGIDRYIPPEERGEEEAKGGGGRERGPGPSDDKRRRKGDSRDRDRERDYEYESSSSSTSRRYHRDRRDSDRDYRDNQERSSSSRVRPDPRRREEPKPKINRIVPLSKLVNDRVTLIKEAFDILGEKRVETMTPLCLLGSSRKELEGSCVDLLESMDEYKILEIIEGIRTSKELVSPQESPNHKTNLIKKKRKGVNAEILNRLLKRAIDKEKAAHVASREAKKNKKKRKEPSSTEESSGVEDISSDELSSPVKKPKKSKKKKNKEDKKKKKKAKKKKKKEAEKGAPTTEVKPANTLMELLELEFRAKAIKALLKTQGLGVQDVDSALELPSDQTPSTSAASLTNLPLNSLQNESIPSSTQVKVEKDPATDDVLSQIGDLSTKEDEELQRTSLELELRAKALKGLLKSQEERAAKEAEAEGPLDLEKLDYGEDSTSEEEEETPQSNIDQEGDETKSTNQSGEEEEMEEDQSEVDETKQMDEEEDNVLQIFGDYDSFNDETRSPEKIAKKNRKKLRQLRAKKEVIEEEIEEEQVEHIEEIEEGEINQDAEDAGSQGRGGDDKSTESESKSSEDDSDSDTITNRKSWLKKQDKKRRKRIRFPKSTQDTEVISSSEDEERDFGWHPSPPKDEIEGDPDSKKDEENEKKETSDLVSLSGSEADSSKNEEEEDSKKEEPSRNQVEEKEGNEEKDQKDAEESDEEPISVYPPPFEGPEPAKPGEEDKAEEDEEEVELAEDETWFERWYKSKKIQKVAKQSKMLGKIRKNVKFKDKEYVKTNVVEKIEDKSESVQQSLIIGSIEEYEKLFGKIAPPPPPEPEAPPPETEKEQEKIEEEPEEEEVQGLWGDIMGGDSEEEGGG